VAEFPRARKEGIAVVSLTAPRRLFPPLAAWIAAAAVAFGAAAMPGLADQVRDQEWWLSGVHVTQAWEITRGAGVTVAVLDTGVDRRQADLSGSVIKGPDFTGSGRHRGSPYWGVHGTAMASLIAGHGHGRGEEDGIIGVAPRAKIISIRVILEERDPLRADTALVAKSPAAIAAGIMYAVRKGAQVIDLPLDPGSNYADGSPGAAAAAGGSAAERKAVQYALASGVVLVAPAGDDGTAPGQLDYPAAYPGVISAGAFDKAFVKAPFTNHAPYVTLTAPGDGLIAASPQGGYAVVSGTSAASAEVAGIAALIKSKYPGLAPQQVSTALTRGTRFHPAGGAASGSGSGTADAALALSVAATMKPAGHPNAPPPHSTTPVSHGNAAVVRDVVIGAAAVTLLLCVILAVRVTRQRKRVRGKPVYPQPTRPLSLRVAGSEAAAAPGPRPESPAGRQRPQLGPVPKLDTAKPARVAAEPPWEPAPKPDSEPPWQEPAARGNDVPPPLPQRTPLNGRPDPVWGAPGPDAYGPSGARPPYDAGHAHGGVAGHDGPPGPAGRPGPPGPPAGAAWPRNPAGPGLPAPQGGKGSGFWMPPASDRPGGPPAEPRGEEPAPPGAGGRAQNGIPAGGAGGQLPVRRPGRFAGPIGREVRPRPEGLPASEALPGPVAPPDPEDMSHRHGRPRPDEPSGPIYVWNPAANTEDFPMIPAGPRGSEAGPPWPSAPPGKADAPRTGPAVTPQEADTYAFPSVPPPPDRGRYTDDDEDDRHL
jgi:Subtilase family